MYGMSGGVRAWYGTMMAMQQVGLYPICNKCG